MVSRRDRLTTLAVSVARKATAGARLTARMLPEAMTAIVVCVAVVSIVVAILPNDGLTAEQAAFIADVRSLASKIRLESLREVPPTDASARPIPASLNSWLSEEPSARPTPIGGVWNLGTAPYGRGWAIRVDFAPDAPRPSKSYMREIDETLDDGVLDTGAFQRLSDSLYCYTVITK